MVEKSTRGAPTVAVVILALLAVANIGYAAFRFSQGLEGNLPLLIGGVVCGTVAIVLAAAKRSS